MKEIRVVFPKGWRVKVEIFGIKIKFTESDILNIADKKCMISETGPHEYLIKGEKEWLENIFTNSFIKKLRETGIVVEIKN